MRVGRSLLLVAAAVAALVVVGTSAAADGDTARGWGIELALPDGWTKVQAAPETPGTDPRTMLVIGTDGVRETSSDCQVASYRVPADGAVVVVVGWRESVGVSGFLPLSALKLRRGTFSCFDGRGAVAQVTRRGRDYQVNVLVGDRASTETVDAALDAARSINAAPRRHD
jgi:hypothetical protein